MRSGWLNAPNRLKAELQTGCRVRSSAFMRSGWLNTPNRLKAELQTGCCIRPFPFALVRIHSRLNRFEF